ncbi:hypothetical protein C482_08668 [Natrialba chahannaoensis JCM 10990]|uniref:Ba3-type terminal oxidase subunit CbaD n=1 Tax=Natrialba chahannaoensis JCM 10990 TaxID=1227492 RepID=M0AQV4_9EURY|nr:hypothetical protein [Natrialba chahannaoensis]ELZ00920.1 hypothetical protein C482_08668 [Natrialba chahannaoensis JCM 10990]
MSQTADEKARSETPEHDREIGHDEFDPIGTLTLIGIYFLILVFLWFFMYFVEFLGNDPTVVGGTLVFAATGERLR